MSVKLWNGFHPIAVQVEGDNIPSDALERIEVDLEFGGCNGQDMTKLCFRLSIMFKSGDIAWCSARFQNVSPSCFVQRTLPAVDIFERIFTPRDETNLTSPQIRSQQVGMHLLAEVIVQNIVTVTFCNVQNATRAQLILLGKGRHLDTDDATVKHRAA